MHKLTGAALAVLLVVVGCAGPSQPSPSPSPSPTPAAALYLRAWQTQALPPPSTFMFAPILTVADGVLIDNNVAVPAIFPGPLLILPNARTITPAGEQAIVDQARELGLLDGETDFSGGVALPGGVTGHLLIIVDGTRYELTGDPSNVRMCGDQLCAVDPATPEAFGAYWSLLQSTSPWLEQHLGTTVSYQPERLAVLLVEPAVDDSGLAPNKVEWPFEGSFADFGQPFAGGADLRCAVVTGADLAKLLPVLQAGNQLSVFVDGAGVERSVNARAVVPDEESPCGS